MTTSFTWFAHGRLLRSIDVQPMGFVLAAMACCAVWTGLYVAISGRPIYRVLWVVPSRYYLVPLLAWAVVAWGWRIMAHLHGWA